MVYIECSADPDADPDDREQWAKANPSYPHRTPLESMLRLRENLPSDESWKREALGIWDAVASKGVIPAPSWADQQDEQSTATERFAWWLKRLEDELAARMPDMQAYRDLVDDVHPLPDSVEARSRKFRRIAGPGDHEPDRPGRRGDRRAHVRGGHPHR
jgi:hypothetical protein